AAEVTALHPSGVVVRRPDLLAVHVHLFGVAGRRGGHAAVAQFGRPNPAAHLPAPTAPDRHQDDESEEEGEHADEETGHVVLGFTERASESGIRGYAVTRPRNLVTA